MPDVLAVPDGLDGPRAADGDLPGAVHEVPRRTRDRRRRATARSGRSWATARWTSPSRWARSRSPAREKLDNLVFVVNCNLQRLDGPVRGNGKIIQELETNFRGAGWNVIKVIWGSNWDPLLEADEHGVLRRLMEECVDGEYQTFKANDGAYVREHFFGRYPETDGDGRRLDGRRDLGAPARRPRPAEGLQRLRGGRPAHGPADRDPREDDQGLRDGRRRRGAQHHAPAEGDERRGAPRDPRPARDPAHRRGGDRRVLPPLGRGQPGDALPPRAARRARREPSGARTPTRSRCRRRRRSRTSSRGAASARTRRRWRSSGS